MKKKLLSTLLALTMTVSLFAGLSTSANADNTDKVTGYLISYVFKAGDTIYGVCEAKKIDFNTNLAKIAKINNIINYNCMYPGTQLWLPSTSATTDAPYYSLLTHVVKSGETVATLCQSYGVDYNSNYKLLAALNANINTFMAGQSFVLPIYVIPAGSTATPTPAPSAAATAAPTPSPTAAPATPAPDGTGTYTGTITEVTGSSITVGGITFGIHGSDLTGTAKTGYTATVTYNAVSGVYSATKVVISAAPASSEPAPIAGDTVSYYLVQHVLQAGETVSGICAALGVDFGEYSDTIIKLNNISNYYNLLPGRTLLIPSKTQPSSGSYYKILGHKLVSGDTIYGLCLTYGLNYYTYADMIKQLNNVKDLGWFYVGQTVYMPLYVSNGSGAVVSASPAVVSPSAAASATAAATAAASASAAPTTSATATASSKITAVTATPAPVNVPAEDTLSYLIIPHAIAAGETVSGICADLGVDYMSCADRIMQLSNVASLNYLMAGKVLLIPSTVYPPSGTPYYKIMAHTLVAGDTVYDLCLAYGLDYLTNASFIQRINNRENLANYYVGQTIYMPLYVSG